MKAGIEGKPRTKKLMHILMLNTFDVEYEVCRMQFRKTNPPFRNKVLNTTSGTHRSVEGVQEFGTVGKVAGSVIVGICCTNRVMLHHHEQEDTDQ